MQAEQLPHPYYIPGMYRHTTEKVDAFIARVNLRYNMDITQRTRKNREIIDTKYAAITVVCEKFPDYPPGMIADNFSTDRTSVLYALKNNYHPEIQQRIAEIRHMI